MVDATPEPIPIGPDQRHVWAGTRYYAEVFGTERIEDIDFIVASIGCDFVAEAGMGEVLEMGIRVPSVGRTSFDFEYEARAAGDGRVVARASSAQVRYDYRSRKKIPLTDDWLDRVAAAQGSRPGPRA